MIPGFWSHPDDESLTRLVAGETTREARIRKHLAQCWKCRSRYEQLEHAALAFVELHRRIIEPNLPPPPERRNLFLAGLDQLEDPRLPFWSRVQARVQERSRLQGSFMNPLLASSAVMLVGAVVLFLMWQRSIPTVSAAELLTRAAASESSSAGKAGVVYQRVRITAHHQTVERDLYRDAEGHRRPRMQLVSAELAATRAKLAVAGVDWEEPLSAEAYAAWRERQQVGSDKVTRTGEHLLTLTTIVLSGPVSHESLTVREEDYHPVQRTVDLADASKLEIAEISYTVLAWSAVNPALFEPLEPEVKAAEVKAAAPKPAAPSVDPAPAPPSEAELDATEIQVLVALNELNADTTEQIRVARGDADVSVTGVVNTEARKREINDALAAISRVRGNIVSVEELSKSPVPTPAGGGPVRAYTVSEQVFPLQTYLKDRGTSQEEISRVSQRLLDACLQVQQQATGLSSLLKRFPSPERLDAASRSALSDLSTQYVRGVQTGLDAEASTLSDLGLATAQNPAASAAIDLTLEVRRNQLLCQGLIASNGSSVGGVPAMASEILWSAALIRAAVQQH